MSHIPGIKNIKKLVLDKLTGFPCESINQIAQMMAIMSSPKKPTRVWKTGCLNSDVVRSGKVIMCRSVILVVTTRKVEKQM